MIDVERLRSGDRDEFHAAVQAYGSLVMHVVVSFAVDQDHAEDLFQAIWVRVFRKLPSFEGAGALESWIHRVATNHCLTELRGRRARRARRERFTREEDETGSVVFPNPLLQAEQAERHASLHRAMAQLPDRQHQAVTLRILEGRTPDEAARIMGTSVATVRSNIRHALKRLRELMEDPGEELPRRRSNH